MDEKMIEDATCTIGSEGIVFTLPDGTTHTVPWSRIKVKVEDVVRAAT